MAQLSKWLMRQDARHRLAFSIFVAAAAALAAYGRVRPWTLAVVTWDLFAVCVLSLAWLTILTTPGHALRRRAQQQDLSRLLIFVFILVAAATSLFAVVFLLHTTKDNHQTHLWLHLLMTVFAVIAAWSLAHTVFGLRYAHTFYGDADNPASQQHAGGLEFPGENTPNYLDFAYFSFVIGMTFQVSDVQVTSREMRQLVLLHGMLSFGFNTVILALAINTVSSLV